MTRVFVVPVWVFARYEAISPYDEQERDVRLLRYARNDSCFC
jgi:hypothetical protein